MSDAQEVIDSLRSFPTVFSCECGGNLWHIDGDEENRLTCPECQRYMVFGGVPGPLATVSGVKAHAAYRPVPDAEPFQPRLWKS